MCRALRAVVDGLKYAKSHEWAKIDGDVATVGISDHAQVPHACKHPTPYRVLLRTSAYHSAAAPR